MSVAEADGGAGASLAPGAVLQGAPLQVTSPHQFTVRLLLPNPWLRALVQSPKGATYPAPPPGAPALLYRAPRGPGERGRVERVRDDACAVRLRSGELVDGARWDGAGAGAGPRVLPVRHDEPEPPVELRCRLHRCEPAGGAAGWSRSSTEAFIKLLGSGPLRLTVRRVATDGLLDVDVESDEYPETVAFMMVLMGQAVPGFPAAPIASSLPPPVRRHYSYDSLARGERNEVKLVHSSGRSFYVIKLERYAECRDINKLIKNCFLKCKRVEEEDPVEGLPIVCKRKHPTGTFSYLRGVILQLEKCKSKAAVYFIDRGIEEVMSVSEMRHPDRNMLTEPALAVHCSLLGQQEFDNEVYKQMSIGANLLLETVVNGENFKKPYIVKVIENISYICRI